MAFDSQAQQLLDVFQRGLGQIRDALKAGVTVNVPDWASASFVTVSLDTALTNERQLLGTANQITLTDNGANSTLVLALPQSIATTSNVQFAELILDNDGLQLRDTDASHSLVITPGSNLTANRILTITTGDAARTLTLSADVSLNQNLLTTSSPTFVALTLSGALSGATTGAFSGAVTLSGTSGNQLIVDTNTLVVNATNNRVGIGTTAPSRSFHDALTDPIRLDSTTQTTVGAAGAADALPANPTGYLQMDIGGTLRVIPFYAQA